MLLLNYVRVFWRVRNWKLQKIRLLSSKCLSVCPRVTREPVNGLSINLVLESFTTMCQQVPVLVKIGQQLWALYMCVFASGSGWVQIPQPATQPRGGIPTTSSSVMTHHTAGQDPDNAPHAKVIDPATGPSTKVKGNILETAPELLLSANIS
jgi:hypothetical protein